MPMNTRSPGRLLGGRKGPARLLGRNRLGPDARVLRPARGAVTRIPRVSVVVPCYNYGHYLPTCLASVLSPPGVDVDIIVVDDASPDGSANVAEELASADPRIAVVRHARNAGHIATYNDGLAKVTGDYVVLLSADDLLAPGSLCRATALMEAHPSIGFAYGHVETFSVEPPRVAREAVGSWTIWPGLSWATLRWQHARNCIWSPEVVMRASVQQRIGGYRADFAHTGDLEMWLRAAHEADVGRVDGPDQAYYRVHDASMHATTFEGSQASGFLVDLLERRRTFEQLADVAPSAEDLRAAQRALASDALRTSCRLFARADVDTGLARALVSFASDTYSDAPGLADWHSAQRLLEMDPRSAKRHPGFLAHEMALRGKDIARRWYWRLAGI